MNNAPMDGRGAAELKTDGSVDGSVLPQTPSEKQAPRARWRETYRVHPAADVFPMMGDDELAKLGENIKANGLTSQISFFVEENVIGASIDYLKANGELADGRNRMQAMERAGIELTPCAVETVNVNKIDPVAFIIGRNIHRRHLTKQQQADLIVVAYKARHEAENKPRKRCEVSKGGRGKVDAYKAAVVESGKAAKIGKRTMEGAIAKAEGRLPEPKRYAAKPLPKPRSGKPVVGIDAARRHYLDLCANPGVDLDEEQRIIFDALHEIASKRAMQAQKRASTLLTQNGSGEAR